MKHLSNYEFVPKKCWVGEHQKICYATREEAEAAALVAQYDHNIPIKLSVYKCEYGDHWHLSSHQNKQLLVAFDASIRCGGNGKAWNIINDICIVRYIRRG